MLKTQTEASSRTLSSRVDGTANDQGNQTTPSYVAFTADERMVGDAVENNRDERQPGL